MLIIEPKPYTGDQHFKHGDLVQESIAKIVYVLQTPSQERMQNKKAMMIPFVTNGPLTKTQLSVKVHISANHISERNMPKIFTIHIRACGEYNCSWVFENQEEVKQWEKEIKPEVLKQYPNTDFSEDSLPGFKIGDTCCVNGEGNDTFTIVGIKQYSAFRYGFALDVGWVEEVAKCHPVPEPEEWEDDDYN